MSGVRIAREEVSPEDRHALHLAVERALGSDEGRGDVNDAVEAILAGFALARAAWSTVGLSLLPFAAVVLGRAAERPGDLATVVNGLRLPELYLATACVLGDAGAILAFEREFFAEIDRAFSRTSHSAELLDDARQNLRERLFVVSASRAPELSNYAGRGSLRGWFRVACVHHTLNLKRAEARAPLLTDPDADELLSTQRDPEILYLHQRYLGHFRAAADDAATQISPSDRAMLQHHYVEKLSIDGIAAIYGIHRVTAARRVNKARDEWVTLIRAALASRLHLEGDELRSVLRLLPSQFSLSLQRVFGSARPPR